MNTNSQETARALRICERCRAEIFRDEQGELCVACLLETSLGVCGDSSVSTGDDCRSPQRPEELGDYELLEEIGRGGQGLVYRARQKSLNRMVAVKVIGLGRWATEAHIKRFRLEAQTAASLNHPCIVPIYEIGESDGSCYFSMQLVAGQRLDEAIRGELMPNRRAAELIIKLARTVSYAHGRGILHRDIKPGKILIDTEGEPHLTDFGLARLLERESTITGTVVAALGTPSYMAPEQAAGDPGQFTNATDVYGLGAVFYQSLTGHPPFVGLTIYETVRLVLETEPRQPRLLNSKVDRDLSTICLKCLEKDPQRRYPSALALAEDLEHWIKREPIQARHAGVVSRTRKWLRRNSLAAALTASLVALAAVVSWNILESGLLHRSPTTGIAVLPFENLSNDREDALFADGVQDDLLTKLGKIASLKVISRTSVMEYRGKRNTREIGNALRISHVLEGSVRKTGAWLHINVQLIDARSDSHIWAEQYDRDLKDVFLIQSEIAQKIAEQLHAKISPAEKLAINRPPTADLTAFDLYNRAKNLLPMTSFSSARANLLQAVDLLDEAVRHDPSFFQAYYQLAHAHDLLHSLGFDHTPTRLALAEAAVQKAFDLRPDAGEAHLARAEHLYRGYLDYHGALAELAAASKTLLNEPEVFELRGYIARRQGRQEEALRNLQRALDLDPRNILTLQQTALSYAVLRRYADEAAVLDRALAVQPTDIDAKIARALVELDWKADTQPLHKLINEMRGENSAGTESVSESWLYCALAEHDPAAAGNALLVSSENFALTDDVIQFTHSFLEGAIARMSKDEGKAKSAFSAARFEQQKIIQAQSNYAPPLCVLGLIDAALGRKQEALREGWRAAQLLPVETDALNGAGIMKYLAMISAWAGDKDLACKQLAAATSYPSTLSYGQLKLLPFWDPLRGDPRFEKIVASLAPKQN
jgi:serine/threonine protein kinase/tetratricopeptide (TPR) repeat protein